MSRTPQKYVSLCVFTERVGFVSGGCVSFKTIHCHKGILNIILHSEGPEIR